MKISCLIATYNADAFIRTALDSIARQTHGDWEIIVVEDGSRGQTEAIVRQFAETVAQPVRYENLGQNRGVSAARNRLLELAQGDAVAFLDADDWWTPSHLESAQSAFARGADVVVARLQLVDLATKRELGVYTPEAELFQHPLRRLFERSAIMTSSGVALRRATAAAVGRFDATLRIGEDRDFWLRCAAIGARFADSGDVSCHYVKHATSTMGKTLLWAQQEVAFYTKHQNFPGVPGGLRRKQLGRALLNYGRLSRQSDPRASARALATAWRLRPYSVPAILQFLVSAVRALKRT